jgi:hypothetical protein
LRSKLKILTKGDHAASVALNIANEDGRRESPTSAQRFEHASAKLWCYLQHQIPQKRLIPKLERLHARASDDIDDLEDEDEDIFASQRHDDPDEDEDLFLADRVDESDTDDDLFAMNELDVVHFLEEFEHGSEDDDLFSPREASRLDSARRVSESLTPFSSRLVDTIPIMGIRRPAFQCGLSPVNEDEEDLFADLEARNPFSTRNVHSAQTRSPGTQISPNPLSSLFSCYPDNIMLEDPDDIDDDLMLDLMLDDRMSEK